MLVARLVEAQISVPRIRSAVVWLDAHVPDWYALTLETYEGRTREAPGKMHVQVALGDGPFRILADAAGQITFRDVPEVWTAAELAASLGCALQSIVMSGPLGKLSEFSDAVYMRPDINTGLPTVVSTRLETSYVAQLIANSSPDTVARLYKLPVRLVERVQQFEGTAA